MEPLVLRPAIQNYAWGTKGKDAYIPRLLGFEPEAGVPYAELWVGAHPKAPSSLVHEGMEKTLAQLLDEQGAIVLGADVSRRFDGKLPFLFKVLSIGEALSIQAHPNLEQAAELHRRDPEHYPDANHKPELAIALDGLTALVGFRSYEELAQQLTDYPSLAALVGEAADAFAGPKPDEAECKRRLKALYAAVMAHADGESPLLQKVIDQLVVQMEAQADELADVFLSCFKRYGYDVGLISILLLNLVQLKPGEGVFLEACTPHAYLKGNIVEVMANSDNVVRAGLTPKFKDVPTLTEMLTYEMGPCSVLDGPIYPIPTDEFDVRRIEMSVGETFSFTGDGRVSLIFVVDGCLQDQDGMQVTAGEAVLMPAGARVWPLGCAEDALVFYTKVPTA